ncbi:hypothetical protein NUH86_01625 [Sphingobium sp. JS3065]|uniref:hypothetical protein n=1 Tax=Sphingobium sp. JS3065 TaxID=2970925 RepID=UPI002264A592|nr:hypothetical protein [Sphingobium sp. JS3065]UZW55530.1 hypothetical protein NUH86_01625 [Sphingobium sp. JS3065]
MAMEQGVPACSLPEGWDALFVPGDDLALFCANCIAAGKMEMFRATAQLPRQQRWRMPGAIIALYRPASREVLIATPDGMATLSEADAEALVAAIGGALDDRSLAGRLAGEAT